MRIPSAKQGAAKITVSVPICWIKIDEEALDGDCILPFVALHQALTKKIDGVCVGVRIASSTGLGRILSNRGVDSLCLARRFHTAAHR